jgi:hypothetical protein
VSPKGYITRDLFIEVLEDLHNLIVDNDIPTPFILFLDGAGPHILIDAADFCISHGIQPFLLRPSL